MPSAVREHATCAGRIALSRLKKADLGKLESLKAQGLTRMMSFKFKLFRGGARG